MRPTRILVSLLAAALLVGTLAADAEAQRRGRRRRTPAPAPAAEAAPEAEAPAEGETAEDATGEEAEAAPEAEAPAAEAPPPPGDDLPPPEDLSPLRAELEAVMNDLVEARARVSVIGRQLFDTRVVVRLRDRAGRDHDLTRLTLRLDGAPIYQGGDDLSGRDSVQVFEGFAAPGPHLLTVELERRERANDAFGYVRADTYRVMVVQGMLTEIGLVLDDDSDMAEGFADGTEGDYDVSLRLRVTARELGENE